jgi:hypothetical protein
MLTQEQRELVSQYNSIVLKYNSKPELQYEEVAVGEFELRVPSQAEMNAMIAEDLLAAQGPYLAQVTRHTAWQPKSASYHKNDLPNLEDLSTINNLVDMIDREIEAERVAFYQARINKMISEDAGMPGFHQLILDCPNHVKYLNDLLKPENSAKIEAIISEIEQSKFNPEVRVETKYRLVGQDLVVIQQSEIDAKYANVDFVRQELVRIRAKRDQLLIACDWIMMSDSNATDDCLEAYRAYRQELRNLPGNISDLRQLAWPAKPAYASKE